MKTYQLFEKLLLISMFDLEGDEKEIMFKFFENSLESLEIINEIDISIIEKFNYRFEKIDENSFNNNFESDKIDKFLKNHQNMEGDLFYIPILL